MRTEAQRMITTDHNNDSRLKPPRPEGKVPTVLKPVGGVIALPKNDWYNRSLCKTVWVVIYIKPDVVVTNLAVDSAL
jgi:hypothetical protein